MKKILFGIVFALTFDTTAFAADPPPTDCAKQCDGDCKKNCEEKKQPLKRTLLCQPSGDVVKDMECLDALLVAARKSNRHVQKAVDGLKTEVSQKADQNALEETRRTLDITMKSQLAQSHAIKFMTNQINKDRKIRESDVEYLAERTAELQKWNIEAHHGLSDGNKLALGFGIAGVVVGAIAAAVLVGLAVDGRLNQSTYVPASH